MLYRGSQGAPMMENRLDTLFVMQANEDFLGCFVLSLK